MNDKTKPVLVCNPYTDKLMNVEPFFDFLKNQPEAKERINHVIRMIVMELSNLSEDQRVCVPMLFGSPSDMYLFLYDLSDLFEKTSECEISLPKKKGASQ